MINYDIGKFPCELSDILSLNEPNCVSQRTVTYNSDGHSVAHPRWGGLLTLFEFTSIMYVCYA
jgi:hypothetical protein